MGIDFLRRTPAAVRFLSLEPLLGPLDHLDLDGVQWVIVGGSPGLIYGDCHGDDERVVFDELCTIVDEAIQLYRQDRKPLPPATSGRFCS